MSINKSDHEKVRDMCLVAVFAALYFVLTSYLTIRAGNLRISLASLPILVCALVCGPWKAATAAFLGEGLFQILNYGITLTTPLWLLPPVIRALIVAYGNRFLEAHDPTKRDYQLLFSALVTFAAIITTVCNTLVTWLDSVIYHYYTKAYVFGDFFVRFATGVVTAIVISLILPPLVRKLRQAIGLKRV